MITKSYINTKVSKASSKIRQCYKQNDLVFTNYAETSSKGISNF